MCTRHSCEVYPATRVLFYLRNRLMGLLESEQQNVGAAGLANHSAEPAHHWAEPAEHILTPRTLPSEELATPNDFQTSGPNEPASHSCFAISSDSRRRL